MDADIYQQKYVIESLPTRGAWIEIRPALFGWIAQRSLPTRGAWIEIPLIWEEIHGVGGRSPHGERGLKFSGICLKSADHVVAPHTGSVD